MRKLLIWSIVALIATTLSAQTTPRSGSQASPPARNTTPSSKSQPALSPRTTLQPAGTTRTNATAEPAEDKTPSRSKTTPIITTPKTVPAKMPETPNLKQDEPTAQVEWLTLEEALEKCKTDKRKIFIDVFTDWCGWCKRMDESTFVDPEVAQYLNQNYYAVKLNAEQQQDIIFNNKTYHFKKNGARGYHELAAELLNNRLSFPTVVFLDETMKVIQPIPGYLEAPKLEAILNYFGSDSHKTTPWETYERKYTSEQK